MFKDYYGILEVSPTATPQDIKAAYRRMSMKWHPDKNPGQNVTSVMQDINEAYAILKDSDKRNRYNQEYSRFEHYTYSNSRHSESKTTCDAQSTWTYDYDVQSDDVRDDIKSAREYAEKIVAEFMASFKKATHDAASGAWDSAKGYVWVATFFVIIGLLVQLCYSTTKPTIISSNTIDDNSKEVSSVSHVDKSIVMETPTDWTTYWIDNNSFSIAIPQTLELRSANDRYTKRLRNRGIVVNTDNVVFQQKGLANSTAGTEDKHYCRVIISHAKCRPGDVYKSDETEPISGDMQSELYDIVSGELAPDQEFVMSPLFKWIDINGQKAIEIKYKRTGNKGDTTNCTMYLLFNYDELVKMIVAYRERESDLWASDMNKIIKTFRWK